jgi:hypothetical protein
MNMIGHDFIFHIADSILRKLAQEGIEVVRNLPQGEPLELIVRRRQYPPKGHHFRSQPDPYPGRCRGYDSQTQHPNFSLRR